MKKIILCFFVALLPIIASGFPSDSTARDTAAETTGNASDGSYSSKCASGMDTKKVYRMGEVYGRDSSKASGRSFPKRLVMPKGAVGVGLQFLWLKMSAADFQALALVSGVDGGISFGNVAPAFTCAYANNNALGLRLAYTNVALDLQSGEIRLFSDDLKFSVSGVGTTINSYGGSIFNRSWFGLDRQGRFALFADVDLGYTYSLTGNASSRARTHSISLGFSPGLEIFVLNGLSLYFSLSFANISYNMSDCYNWIPANSSGSATSSVQDVSATSDGYWSAVGSSNSFKGQVRLNLLDLHFGLAYYF